MPGPGRPFQKGQPKLAGRKAGTPNKRTRDMRAALEATAREIGGEAGLVRWIKESAENERDFWVRMFTRLLPVQLEGSGERGEIELSVDVKLTPEELARKLEERGLSARLFGARPATRSSTASSTSAPPPLDPN